MAANRPTEYTAIYPATPIFNIGNNKYNLIENLKKFTEAFAQSLKEALNGNKIVLVRIAHVGESEEGFMRNIYSSTPESIFLPKRSEGKPRDYPYAQGFYRCIEYVGAGKYKPRCVKEKKFPNIVFHADPLIFARSGGTLIESITYGEDDAETRYIWRDWIKQQITDVSNVDAYILFNSTFRIIDKKSTSRLQMLHGGFKALAWNYLSCIFKEIKGNCLSFRSFKEVSEAEIRERFGPNPHTLRITEDEVEREWRERRIIYTDLMILGNKESWFFSLPIAPPPLYFLAQGPDKIEWSREIIIKRLGRNKDRVRSMVSEVLETYGLNGVPGDIRQLLEGFIVESYYRGEASNFISSFRKGVEETMERNHNKFYESCLEKCSKEYEDREDIRGCAKDCVVSQHIVPDLMLQFHVTPQYRVSKDRYGRIRYSNYSYLDFVVSMDFYNSCRNSVANDSERYRCSIAWVFGLSLLVLLDSYIDFVERCGC